MDQNVWKERLKTIEFMKERVLQSLAQAPEGRMRCQMAKGKYPQYYYVAEQQLEQYPRGKYIKKDEEELKRRLAQKEYDENVLKVLGMQEKTIENLLEKYDERELVDVYDKLPEAKRMLVTPYVQPDDLYVKGWIEKYKGEMNPFPFETIYYSEKGEQVRSKTEKIIADKLFLNEIHYVYEPSLQLKKLRQFQEKFVYPDFVVLNLRTRKTYFWEHFGRMDDDEYCKKALEKIERYEENGIFVGEKLIVTMESSLKGVGVKQLESIIDRYFR